MFLEKLFEMFRIYGVKTLTMDDIEKSFLYQRETIKKYSQII